MRIAVFFSIMKKISKIFCESGGRTGNTERIRQPGNASPSPGVAPPSFESAT